MKWVLNNLPTADNVIKRRGPKMLPCGTPREISRNSEAVPLTATVCFLIDKYDLNQPSVDSVKL